jgi:hypothetical protein
MLLHGYAGSQLGNITQRIKIVPAELPERTAAMFGRDLPRLLGSRHVVDQIAVQGHDWLFWPLWGALALAAVRGAYLLIQRWREPAARIDTARRAPGPAFALYLTAVGALAIAAYVLTRTADTVVDRYLLLTLYAPIGLVALLFTLDRAVWSRAIVVGVVALTAAGSAGDHWHQWRRYAADGGQPNQMRVLADGLLARGIHVASAGYWRAYKLTFLTDEQVKVASTDVVRIEEYQQLAAREGDRLVRIEEAPCPGGESVGVFFLCREGR